MTDRVDGIDWQAAIGYAVGVGICSMATLGVWLQYASHAFTVWSAGAASLAVGLVVGAVAYLIRRPRL